jgi:predicted AlkP superfamily pyrophosphatase or phosphodiesterase
MSFPTLSYAPKSIKKTVVDNTLRSPTEAGYVQTRPRTTRAIYDFDVSYLIPLADKGALEAFDASVTGSTIFSWYNVDDTNTYNVRFTKRVSSSRTPDQKGFWDVSFSLQSV